MLGQVISFDVPMLGRAGEKIGEPGANGAATRPTLTITRGHCRPLGATVMPEGVNFAVLSRHAQAVHLLLYRDGHEGPVAEVPLDPALNKTGDIWHVGVRGLPADVLYGYRVNGPFNPR